MRTIIMANSSFLAHACVAVQPTANWSASHKTAHLRQLTKSAAPCAMQCLQRQQHPRRLRCLSQRYIITRGLGKDFLTSWGDLASLVASDSSKGKTPFDSLASKLGKILYADLGGWHLRLR